MATFKDPAFLTDCVQQRLECSNAKTGAELDGLITVPTPRPPTSANG